ncbi:MAG: insulinase family protein, partial [Proteobacteria bacterium]|nr:insulinase family protein [Pseudomonadota bacterium]
CLHIPLPKGDPRFQITYLNGTGSRFEPKEWSGISHLLEHMMFRGSAKYPSFSDLSIAFERLGGEWNAATGHEYTEFYFNGTVKKSKEAIELFADFLMRPALHDLATELKIVKRELEGELNENGVSTDPDYHIATKIWPNSAMAMPIIGTPDSLGNINSKILRSWYEKN